MKTFYITSPIFYPNAKLHMGHAYTMTLCDVLYRAHRLQGESVYLLTGSDENTGKILETIKEKGQTVEEYLTSVKKAFEGLYTKLDIQYDQFIQTSDTKRHWPGAIALWNKLVEAGDIYAGIYKGLYCTGCETFYTEKDLVDGCCPIHFTKPEVIEEKNYFFRLSKYTDTIRERIQSDQLMVVPDTRKNEILALLERGLEDVSFSRPKHVVPHGIPVPNDPDQVIYVWCDALVNYISALGYGRDDDLFKKFWPASVHVIGKDILRFHTAIWPAMLLSAGIELPKHVLVHGLITSGGHKMSKSLGNVIDPLELIEEYGAEAVRYYLAREISPFEDGDLTKEKFKESYNANLANGLGNLVSRIMKMSETHLDTPVDVSSPSYIIDYSMHIEAFDIQKAINVIWEHMKIMDTRIQETKPFSVIKTDVDAGKQLIMGLVQDLCVVAQSLEPFLPVTSQKIKELIAQNKAPETPLFIRKE